MTSIEKDTAKHVPIRFGYWLICVVLLAIVLRSAWAVLVPVVPMSDSARYDFYAQNMAAGKGYCELEGPTAYWPVGPAFVYSLAYRIAGYEDSSRFVGAIIANLFFGVGTVALVGFAGRRWLGDVASLIAALLLAIWPSQVMFTTVLSSEVPMLFFLVGAMAIWFADKPNVFVRAIIAGILLACASFMRPTALLLPIVFCLSMLVWRRHRLRTLVAVGVMFCVMLACISPWTVRNHRIWGEFVLISTNGGPNLWMGNNPDTHNVYQELPNIDAKNEVDRDRQLRQRALDHIRQQPTAFVKRFFVKAVRLHERETINVVWNEEGLSRRYSDGVVQTLKWGGQVYWVAMLVFSVIGVVMLLKRWSVVRCILSPMVLLWLYFTFVHSVTVIQDRYHFAFIPFLAMLAAVVIERWWRGETKTPAES